MLPHYIERAEYMLRWGLVSFWMRLALPPAITGERARRCPILPRPSLDGVLCNFKIGLDHVHPHTQVGS